MPAARLVGRRGRLADDVLLADRRRSRNADHFRGHDRCTYLEQDILDVDLPALLDDASVVFHLAAQAGVRASWGQSFDVYTQLNITVLQRLLEAARDADLDRFVFASSSSVYGDAEALPDAGGPDPAGRVSPYGATKALGEHLTYLYFRNYGVPDGQPALLQRLRARASARTWPSTARSRRPSTASSSACSATAARRATSRTWRTSCRARSRPRSTRPPGSIYNLGGGSRVSMLEALAIIGQEMGDSLNVVHEESQQGDARDTAADISAAERDLGYAPAWTVERGLGEQVAWHRSRS